MLVLLFLKQMWLSTTLMHELRFTTWGLCSLPCLTLVKDAERPRAAQYSTSVALEHVRLWLCDLMPQIETQNTSGLGLSVLLVWFELSGMPSCRRIQKAPPKFATTWYKAGRRISTLYVFVPIEKYFSCGQFLVPSWAYCIAACRQFFG